MDFINRYPALCVIVAILIICSLLQFIINMCNKALKKRNLELIEQAQRLEAEKRFEEQQKHLQELNRQDAEKYTFINEKIEQFMSTLTNKYRQLAYKDDYGIIKIDRFEHELDYFLEKIINEKNILTSQNKKDIKETITNYMLKNIDIDDIDINDINPYNFEKQCANVLREYGWEANTTPKSSDQGVDVIATKKGKIVAIQCKLYSKPVGNKAVQEVNSGKTYYKADYAAVVTNNTYTTSARQLARNCGVLLLYYDDLKNLDKALYI